MISIIIPTWNEEKVIGRTINNIKKGLHSIPYEIIIADDGSKDNTQKIARKLGAKIAAARRKKNIAAGRNRGASKARGDYLVFIDADITIKEPDRFFKKALKDFEDNKNLVGLSCYIRVLSKFETRRDAFFRSIHNEIVAFSNNFLNFGTATGEFQMIPRKIFEKIGGYNENIIASEDYEIFSRLSKIGETRIDRSLVVYENGRRAHKVGWIKLLSIWIINGIMVSLSGRSMSKEWKEIR